jgi:transposase
MRACAVRGGGELKHFSFRCILYFGDSLRSELMAKAYSDDLRRRFLSAYEAGEGTLEELAERFMVSLAYGKKVRGQFQRSGQMERVEQRRGTPRKLLDGPREQLRVWLIAAPDLTLEQLRERLHQDCRISISRAQVARALKRMGLKLKKSHSTPASETQKKPVAGEKISSSISVRSRRKS